MLNCDFCQINTSTLCFTRCCKTPTCLACCDNSDKKLVCACGRPLPQGSKNYTECSQVIAILTRFTEGKRRQCDRCELKAQIQCLDCDMIYCQGCNSQLHGALGFARHNRKRLPDPKNYTYERAKKRQVTCLQHGQTITSGCQCGTALCSSCLKQHKENCGKGYKLKLLKQFKDEYFLNVLLKMRQISFYKQRLSQDKSKYKEHFESQTADFEASERLICEQFQYLKKMLQIKYSEVKTKLSQYWKNCQNVYQTTLVKIDEQLKKYDSYSELMQMFSQNLSNLDYFDKKIKRFNVSYDFINVKSSNFDQAQTALMNLGIAEKPWSGSNIDAAPAQNPAREDVRLINSMQNTSELILDYTHNPLKDRQISLMASHSEIFYNFIHLPYQNVSYEIQYGIGMKIKGQQIFKKIKNTNGYGTIEGLNPNTTYRIRMRVADSQWGPVSEVTTLDIPKFSIASSSFAKSMNENTVQLGKGGIIYGSNQINFGVHRWVIKFTSKTISYEDSQTACMSVGVSNKQTKKAVFVGTTLNYGYQKSEIVLKILLDCNEKRLVIHNCTNSQEQNYQNLPNFPIFPTIQNKGNGQIMVRYSLMSDDPTLF